MMSSDIILRPVRRADVPHFYAHALAPEAIQRAQPATAPLGWQAFRARWTRTLDNPAMVCRTVTFQGEVAGYVACFQQLGRPSIGYWFGPAFWGRGVATQAVGRFLQEFDARPLFARVAADNPASLWVLSANGFQRVADDVYFSAPFDRKTREIILRLDPNPARHPISG